MALSDALKKAMKNALGSGNETGNVGDEAIASSQPAAAVADIAVPGSATAADCANKINELMASLRVAKKLS